MDKKKEFVHSFIIGFALFSVFFGAGNLIFPPAIGVASGTKWMPAIAGLTFSAIILPILTVIAIGHMDGRMEKLCRPVAPWFSGVYLIFFILFAGCLGVPRQGGTAIETGLFGLFPQFGGSKIALFIGLLIYFGLVFYLVFNPSKIVERVGKILTPFLLIILVGIVIASIVKPIGTPGDTGITNAFTNSLLTGYQTGDVVVGIVVAAMFVSSIKDYGYKDKKSMDRITLKAAVVAFFGLLIVYGGLLYLGATGMDYFSADTDQTALLIGLVKMLVGNVGSGALSVAVFLACLTTSTGIISSIATMTKTLTKGKIKYQYMVIFGCSVGILIGTIGVSSIIKISFPTFFLLYPVAIVLTLLGVFEKYVPNHGSWKGATLMAALIGIYDMLKALSDMGVSIHLGFLENLYGMLPLANYGMAWIFPSIVGFVVGTVIIKVKGLDSYPMFKE